MEYYIIYLLVLNLNRILLWKIEMDFIVGFVNISFFFIYNLLISLLLLINIIENDKEYYNFE